ncbi:cation diffusion facilitator family transporter [uncultured Modestobacter sp.]|uniref:cation diffusion facilitator family transporter n=1 Tax=uncultured Modestobacter sp. TaxID=380048 RepID=UPI002610B512|nr:cation diffusion facilitator family transporter [uncultured Modestobacter sp.]
MSGDHGHDHGAGTGASSPDHRRRLAIVLTITTTVLIVEVIGAVVSGSLALLADAGHMLTDAAGLTIALIAANLALRPATPKRTWGYRRAEVLGATLQAAVLLAVGVYVFIEGIRRLFEPPEVGSTAMVVFGVIGLVGNLVSMLVLTRGRGSNVNMRAAFLEVVNDALGSVAVLLAALIIALTGWLQADAVVSMLIALLIVPRTLKLLRETVSVLLESAPPGLDLDDVRTHLLSQSHVLDVHDLHASQITSELPVLTAHVVVDDSCFQDGHAPRVLDQLQSCLASHFPISVEHSTIQLEPRLHATHEHPGHR